LAFSTAELKERFLIQVSRNLMQPQPIARFRQNASKCRDLASSALTPAARDVLTGLAEQYEERVVNLECIEATHPGRRPAFKWPLS
jgi:hypothetical protein